MVDLVVPSLRSISKALRISSASFAFFSFSSVSSCFTSALVSMYRRSAAFLSILMLLLVSEDGLLDELLQRVGRSYVEGVHGVF